MNKQIIRLHAVKIELEMLGCWYLAQIISKRISEEVEVGTCD